MDNTGDQLKKMDNTDDQLKKMDNTDDQIEKDDDLDSLYLDLDKDLDVEYLDLTLTFPGRQRHSTAAEAFKDLYASLYNRPDDASTSHGTPFSYKYPPQRSNIDVPPESSRPESFFATDPVVRRRQRKNRPDKPDIITPPYPWAGDRRCTVLTMKDLISRDILAISGDVHCKKCDRTYEIVYALEDKFNELCEFITENVQGMRYRAHTKWLYPALLDCRVCNEEKCVNPVIAEKKRSINWLFLLLGQMLGFCTGNQLKYFCRHTKSHRTGATDRCLFVAYMNLCRQIDPDMDQDFYA